jgi:hypothetical protein
VTPKPNALDKIHKLDKPTRQAINNIQAPSYKFVKYLNKKLMQPIKLPCTYATRNSQEVAQDLNSIRINNEHKLTTIDIKDIHVKLSTQNIISITKFSLDKYNNHNTIKQTLELKNVILNQNYFQYNDKYFKPTQGIAMDPPISSTLAEI